MDILEEHIMEEIYPNIEGEEDTRISYDREEHQREVKYKENEDLRKVHALMQGLYMKQKDASIKRGF